MKITRFYKFLGGENSMCLCVYWQNLIQLPQLQGMLQTPAGWINE